MPEAITDTSPLLHLHRIGTLNWLRELFSAIVVPSAVVRELQEGREGRRETNVTLREGPRLLPTEAVFGLSVDRLGPIRAEEFEERHRRRRRWFS